MHQTPQNANGLTVDDPFSCNLIAHKYLDFKYSKQLLVRSNLLCVIPTDPVKPTFLAEQDTNAWSIPQR